MCGGEDNGPQSWREWDLDGEGKGRNLAILRHRSERGHPRTRGNSARTSAIERGAFTDADGTGVQRRGGSWQVGYVWTELTYEVGARPATILHEQPGPIRGATRWSSNPCWPMDHPDNLCYLTRPLEICLWYMLGLEVSTMNDSRRFRRRQLFLLRRSPQFHQMFALYWSMWNRSAVLLVWLMLANMMFDKVSVARLHSRHERNDKVEYREELRYFYV